MKKLILSLMVIFASNVEAVQVIGRDGYVYQSPQPVQHHYCHNYVQSQPIDNSLSTRYYRGEISTSQYIDSKIGPMHTEGRIIPDGRGGYIIR